MGALNAREVTPLEQTYADAQRWRELMTLLRRKAYRELTPVQIAEHLPDLRELYLNSREGARRDHAR